MRDRVGYRLGMDSHPHAEEPQRGPGGADAAEEIDPREDEGRPQSRDLPPDIGPAHTDMPEEVTEPDEKSQEPESGSSGEGPVAEEPPA